MGGRVKKVFGDGYPTSGLNRVDTPTAVTRDAQGTMYIAEEGNNRILKVAQGNTSGGIGVSGLLFPTAIAVDASGALYFADIGYCKVYRQLNGTISTVAGNGQCLYSGG